MEPTVTTLLMGGLTAVSGIVGLLWKQLMSNHRDTKEKLEDCEDDRRCLWQAIAEDKGVTPTELRERYSCDKKAKAKAK